MTPNIMKQKLNTLRFLTQTLTFKPSSLFLTVVSVAVIVAAIVIVDISKGPPEKALSKIITVGPVWPRNSWSCTSDADFIVHGVLRGLQGAQLTISISGLGTQSLYTFDASGKMESFSVGSPAGHVMTITRTGTVTGWITLQTTSGATASCTA